MSCFQRSMRSAWRLTCSRPTSVQTGLNLHRPWIHISSGPKPCRFYLKAVFKVTSATRWPVHHPVGNTGHLALLRQDCYNYACPATLQARWCQTLAPETSSKFYILAPLPIWVWHPWSSENTPVQPGQAPATQSCTSQAGNTVKGHSPCCKPMTH